MGEALRQRYAKALGLSLWYGRARLPGAPQSPVRDFSGFVQDLAPDVSRPIATGKLSGGSRRPLEGGGSSGSVGSIVKAAGLIQAAVPRQAESAPRTVVTEPEAEQVVRPEGAAPEPPWSRDEPVPECQVRAYRCGKYIFLNLAHPETDASREAVLLANLVSVLWQGLELVPLFDWGWPVFSNDRLPGQGKQVAAKILTEQLSRCSGGASGVILLGYPPIFADAVEGSPVSLGSLTPGADEPRILLSTFSLGELLLEPQRKRDVWRRLRHLSDRS